MRRLWDGAEEISYGTITKKLEISLWWSINDKRILKQSSIILSLLFAFYFCFHSFVIDFIM